jgi:hypothetical protein
MFKLLTLPEKGYDFGTNDEAEGAQKKKLDRLRSRLM